MGETGKSGAPQNMMLPASAAATGAEEREKTEQSILCRRHSPFTLVC